MAYKTLEEQLLARTVKVPSGCWLWQGSLRNGYGRLKRGGRLHSVHRVSWELYCGPLTDDILVLHKCDVRNCINPKHLFIGDHQANSDDKWDKDRGYFPPKLVVCLKGHSLEDAYIAPSGKRTCRTCKNAAYMAWYRRRG
jgi:hypothetical protein